MNNLSIQSFAGFAGNLFVGILFCLLTIQTANAQSIPAQAEQFPFRATVTGSDAVVRGGPGKTYYGTDRLRPGTEVKVFRRDERGWLAIRPPERSFSLIQRNEVEIYQNGLAKVTADETVAWVGTRLNAVNKPLWQVKLKKGEMLEVLGVVDRQKYELSDNEPDWVQIQPPKGEFRWIAATNIKRIGDSIGSANAPEVPQGMNGDLTGEPTGELAGELTENDLNDLQIESTISSQSQHQGPRPFDTWEPSQDAGQWDLNIESNGAMNGRIDSDGSSMQQDFNTTSIAPASQGWKPARQTIANFTSERSGFRAENSSQNVYTNQWNNSPAIQQAPAMNASVRSNIFDANDSMGATQPYRSPEYKSSSPASNVGAPTLLTPDFAATSGTRLSGNATLLELEMKLTKEMIKPPPQWDLVNLAAEVQRMRGTVTAPQDIEFVNRLIEKIRNCREIKAGYRATEGTGTRDGAGGAGPTDLQTMNRTPGTNGGQANLLYDYDAYGTLNELVRDGGSGPTTYVLQDASGKITHHINAPPGVNLRRYLNQRVGIIGNRGYHQRLKLDHVTADRVIAIDSLRR